MHTENIQRSFLDSPPAYQHVNIINKQGQKVVHKNVS